MIMCSYFTQPETMNIKEVTAAGRVSIPSSLGRVLNIRPVLSHISIQQN